MNQIKSPRRFLKLMMVAAFFYSFILSGCGAPPPDLVNKSVDELIVDLKSEDSILRAQAAVALGMKKAEAKPAVPMLVKLLSDNKPHVRTRAMDALSKIGEPAVPDLILAISNRDRNVRFYAAHALSKISSPPAQEAYKAWMDKEGKNIIRSQ